MEGTGGGTGASWSRLQRNTSGWGGRKGANTVGASAEQSHAGECYDPAAERSLSAHNNPSLSSPPCDGHHVGVCSPTTSRAHKPRPVERMGGRRRREQRNRFQRGSLVRARRERRHCHRNGATRSRAIPKLADGVVTPAIGRPAGGDAARSRCARGNGSEAKGGRH